MTLIVFTDLDGTLLNGDDYRYDAAIPVLEDLKKRQIPVIPVTSKTRQEVEVLCQDLNLNEPFIVENGSAIFIPLNSQQFSSDELNRYESYHLKRLGCTYSKARDGLAAIAARLGEPLQGFGDLSEAEIVQLTGLSLQEAQRAKAREFTEPFITPTNIVPSELKQVIEASGFKVVMGDRFSHLIGSGAGKGKAVEWLKQHYRGLDSSEKLVTIGLGNSPNDIEMLENVDLPVVIPGKKGAHPQLEKRGWQIAIAEGSKGWAIAVAELCDRYLA
jgi:mannosyl-3-phosphoglycerate phosphatase